MFKTKGLYNDFELGRRYGLNGEMHGYYAFGWVQIDGKTIHVLF